MAEEYPIRLRGLPYSATENDIIEFLKINPEHIANVYLCKDAGRNNCNGKAYAFITDRFSAESAKGRTNEHLGGRYIEIFEATREEMEGDDSVDTSKKEVEEAVAEEKEGEFIVKMRGLPYRTSEGEVKDFLKVNPGHVSELVLTKNPDGRASGEAYAVITDQWSAEAALGRNNEHLGGRYIEVYKSNREAMDKSLSGTFEKKSIKMANFDPNSICLKLRGLPFYLAKQDEDQKKSEVCDFLQIEQCKMKTLIMERKDGKFSGNCFIEVEDQETMEACMQRDRDNFGTSGRYVEVFQADPNEISQGDGGAHGPWDGMIKMRGLPFESSIKDVEFFFEGLTWVPGGMYVPMSARGSSTGEAYVQFESLAMAQEAMKRDKNKVGNRYIELFKSSNNDKREAMIKENKSNFGGGGGFDGGNFNQFQQHQQNWGGLNMAPGMNGGMNGGMQGGHGGGKMGGGFGNFGGMNRGGRNSTPYGRGGFQGGMNQGGMNQGGMNQGGMNQGGQRNYGGLNMGGGAPMGGNMGGGFNNGSGFGQFPGGNNAGNSMQGGSTGGWTQMSEQKPAGPNYPIADPDPGSPFPHIVGMSGIPNQCVMEDIQQYYKGYKPIAVNMIGSGRCDVAFKDHDAAVRAMEKHQQMYQGSMLSLVLKSKGGFKMINDAAW